MHLLSRCSPFGATNGRPNQRHATSDLPRRRRWISRAKRLLDSPINRAARVMKRQLMEQFKSRCSFSLFPLGVWGDASQAMKSRSVMSTCVAVMNRLPLRCPKRRRGPAKKLWATRWAGGPVLSQAARREMRAWPRRRCLKTGWPLITQWTVLCDHDARRATRPDTPCLRDFTARAINIRVGASATVLLFFSKEEVASRLRL